MPDAAPPPRSALRFVVLLGVVSLFADMTYEGARSVTGPFLALLGASASVVGVVAGAGELAGYALRIISGRITDRTHGYWPITITGYAVNLFAVPLLALAGNWEIAAALIVLERTGKAIRNPARNAMLAHATQSMGRGWGFGLHEAMDQTGALLGPLVAAAVLEWRGQYRPAFAILLVPACFALAALLIARRSYPRPAELEVKVPTIGTEGTSRTFWLYAAGVAAVGLGYAHFTLIAYHFAKSAIMSPAMIPLLYALGMGVAGVAALALGRLYDRLGLGVAAAGIAVAAASTPLVFIGGAETAAAGMVLWGIGAGVQGSVLRAAVAELGPAATRATAYGVFDTAFGVAWFVGSITMGVLYDHSVMAVVIFSIIAQVLAIPPILIVARTIAARRQHARV